jgi:hypothetical protein
MNQQPYHFKEMGTTDVKTTNVARIVTATTTTLITAPAGVQATYQPGTLSLLIYQIDWDMAGATNTLVVGDNNAVDGTDRIFLNTAITGRGSITFPQGLVCNAGKRLAAVTTGTVNTWVRVTYQII